MFAKLGMLCLAGLAAPALAEPITVAWREKPPYHYTEDGVDKGFLLERGKLIFARAGVEARFVEEPIKRIWSNFRSGKTSYCSLGRYRLQERDDMVKYSEAMFTDPPQAVLVSPQDYALVKSYPSLAAMLQNPSLSVGVSDGASFGEKVDALLRKAAAVRVERTVDAAGMIRMVAMGRVSVTLADRYVWEFMRSRDPLLQQVKQVEFPDMPPGLHRYILCSKDVPEATMRKLNKAIASLKAAGADSK